MKAWITAFLVLTSAGYAAEVTGAQAELLLARTALEEGRFAEAFQHAARVQVFYYRDAEAVATALYYEALANHKTGGLSANVSALTELKTLYPNSEWCRKAIAEFKTEGTE